ncbi:SRPBCC family protein [Primorskyibacter sp. S187A]|uniref:SRPBCC family protein n=1 Tax=Primorskyibacter sp. S187A TaxID=3415130 RepID=UPI003C7B1098
MEFTTKEDINATIDEVFAVLSDVDAIEKRALRRGIEVRRTTAHVTPTPGMGWQAVFQFRGRKRTSDITLVEYDAPQRMVFESVTGGLATRFSVDLVQMSKAHTRVTTNAMLKANTLSARLLVQSMKLAKSKINRKFAVRMTQFARDIEERAARLA